MFAQCGHHYMLVLDRDERLADMITESSLISGL